MNALSFDGAMLVQTESRQKLVFSMPRCCRVSPMVKSLFRRFANGKLVFQLPEETRLSFPLAKLRTKKGRQKESVAQWEFVGVLVGV